MAKGQKRSTKEIRKPKQDKAAPKAEGGFANQLRAANSNATPKKGGG
jgi:hypothetical protein